MPDAGALHARGGNFHDLQEGRQDAEGTPSHLRAGLRDRRPHFRAPGAHRQHRFRRPPDPRARLARPSRDHADVQSRRLSHSGAYLDAVVRRARLAVRLRFDFRLLRRSGRSHLCRRDRSLVRPADELAAVDARPLPAGLKLRRPLAGKARPRSDDVRLPDRLLRHPPGAGDRARFCRHRRILSRGGQVSSRRPPQMRREVFAARDAGPGRALPGVRRRHDRRRPQPRRDARRPQRGRGGTAGDGRRRVESRCLAGNAWRDRKQRTVEQDRRARLQPAAVSPRPRARHSAGRPARGYFAGGFFRARRSRGAAARRQGDPRRWL